VKTSLPLSPERERRAVRLLMELLLAEVAGRRFRWRFWWRLGGRLDRFLVSRGARAPRRSSVSVAWAALFRGDCSRRRR
jgi:hypothetical protein